MALGGSIRRLADAALISELDISPQSLTIAPYNDRTLGWYKGEYAMAGIVVEDCGITTPLSVSATRFQSLTAMFSDAIEVSLRPRGNALYMGREGREVSLQFNGEPSLDRYEELLAFEPIVEVHRQTFAREIEIASAAATAGANMANPILSGIRIVATGKLLGIQAANGKSLAFETHIEAKTKPDEKFQIIAPRADILVALHILMGDTIKIGLVGRGIVMQGIDSIVRIPQLSGTWPNLTAMRDQPARDRLEIESSALRMLGLAAKVYETTTTVRLEPTEGGVLLKTTESEIGQYIEALSGSLSRRYAVDLKDLEVAGKMSNGTIGVDFCETLAIARSDNRKLYMLLWTPNGND